METTLKRIEQRPYHIAWDSDLPELLTRIYSARQVNSAAELSYGLDKLAHYEALSGIDDAMALLVTAFTERQSILFVGDFDVDGASSCALGVRAFAAMGAAQVTYLVPNRFEFGYGLTPELVEVACQNKPDLIVTVDNGIASLAGVEAAIANGIKVLVTDHHLPGETLPAAHAIVNPNVPGDQFPSKHLAGVGVVFYLCLALRQALRRIDWFEQQGISELNMAQYLDLVALGTVADLVKLDYNNRILVAQGLDRVRAGKACPGIMALLEIVGRPYYSISASDFAFALGPRINAAGRMDDMTVGIECLLTDDYRAALQLADRLNELNLARREVEQQMRDEAERIVERLLQDSAASEIPSAVCLYDPGWHQGVIGIVASRIKEIYHRPVIVFAHTDENTLKGSARSIKGLNIRDALAIVAVENPDLIQAFGGHAMAAGLSLSVDAYQRFTDLFPRVVGGLLAPEDLQQVLYTDGSLTAQELNLDTAELLFRAGPWGQGFPEPLFEGEFSVLEVQILKDKHLKLLLRSDNSSHSINAIAFNVPDVDSYMRVSWVHIVFRLSVNEFRGTRTAQLMIEHFIGSR